MHCWFILFPLGTQGSPILQLAIVRRQCTVVECSLERPGSLWRNYKSTSTLPPSLKTPLPSPAGLASFFHIFCIQSLVMLLRTSCLIYQMLIYLVLWLNQFWSCCIGLVINLSLVTFLILNFICIRTKNKESASLLTQAADNYRAWSWTYII